MDREQIILTRKELFMDSCKNGDLKMIIRIIDVCSLPRNSEKDFIITGFNLAASYQHLQVVNYLLDYFHFHNTLHSIFNDRCHTFMKHNWLDVFKKILSRIKKKSVRKCRLSYALSKYCRNVEFINLVEEILPDSTNRWSLLCYFSTGTLEELRHFIHTTGMDRRKIFYTLLPEIHKGDFEKLRLILDYCGDVHLVRVKVLRELKSLSTFIKFQNYYGKGDKKELLTIVRCCNSLPILRYCSQRLTDKEVNKLIEEVDTNRLVYRKIDPLLSISRNQTFLEFRDDIRWLSYMMLLSDGLYRLKDIEDNKSRFCNIVSKLPVDLQTLISCRLVKSKKRSINSNDLEVYLKENIHNMI